ncbi:YbaB/EbfC family nucleoid-associated protein [Actinomadura livida]|uniref:DNA-binding protein YbaB n=1 Tax=Actinomadura livida TaxID=79909 RepID=A0A7W7II31_9ACTN|nr:MULTISPECIES: YbaB/EbfC family nucleoid-associated protein [Actinomadura]MBB4777420.1 DNA-binding protein YbaB [Actinomadura catellatispora]GGU31693.1 hypothetical protein GCM10010208_65520 [Actinomadura livida]
MTESHGFSETELDVLAEEAAKEMQKATELQERLKELVGRAESCDGRVRLGLTAEAKIVELEIDPRAMRTTSAARWAGDDSRPGAAHPPAK